MDACKAIHCPRKSFKPIHQQITGAGCLETNFNFSKYYMNREAIFPQLNRLCSLHTEMSHATPNRSGLPVKTFCDMRKKLNNKNLSNIDGVSQKRLIVGQSCIRVRSGDSVRGEAIARRHDAHK
jgi:hypothetical protein